MKRALVTGASGDIGSAIAVALAESGVHVIAHANQNRDRVDELCRDISSKGGSAEAVVFDVTDAEQTKTELEQILQNGPVQILVNNAGIHDDAPLAGMKPEQWHRVVDVSLNGFYNVTQPLLLPMMSTRWGRIITLSSIAGVMGNRGQANYAAAKAGVIGASKSLAIELASRGITANVVAPGIIEGNMTEGTFDKASIKQLVPMARAGKPSEVASLVRFLSSDEAGYVSGQVIGVNGAMA